MVSRWAAAAAAAGDAVEAGVVPITGVSKEMEMRFLRRALPPHPRFHLPRHHSMAPPSRQRLWDHPQRDARERPRGINYADRNFITFFI